MRTPCVHAAITLDHVLLVNLDLFALKEDFGLNLIMMFLFMEMHSLQFGSTRGVDLAFRAQSASTPQKCHRSPLLRMLSLASVA